MTDYLTLCYLLIRANESHKHALSATCIRQLQTDDDAICPAKGPQPSRVGSMVVNTLMRSLRLGHDFRLR